MSIPPARGGIWATCEDRAGSLRDTILHSAGANATHGLRRSNADKRRAVLLLLEDEEWSRWSNSEIARRCVVSDKTVASLRIDLTSEIRSETEARTYQDRYGNVTQMRTSSIGRKPVEAPAGNRLLRSPLLCQVPHHC